MLTMSNVRRLLPLSVLLMVTVFSLVLVPVIAIRYSYDNLSLAASAIGFVIVLTVAACVWFVGRRMSHCGNPTVINRSIWLGLLLGLLWVIEISINNFIAPPLPMRDIIDNSFWALIALGIFAVTLIATYQSGRILEGIIVGMWSGLASGAMACSMALALIVFGMHFIISDPLNVTEWAARRANAGATTMAAYFAYETFAGAFLHLIVLGIMMGMLLGFIGGFIGKGIKRGHQWTQMFLV
jgi:hypothetical protein